MTGQRLKMLAATAAAAALLAIAVRPLLHVTTGARPLPVAATAVPAPAGAVTAALRAARAALACRPRSRWPTRACGALPAVNADAYRTAAGRVVVLLVGTLHDRSGDATPVAIRVRLTRVAVGWRGAVTPP